MHIRLQRENQAVHFKASNENGSDIHFDGPKSIGGEGKGMSPMEVLLSAVAGCSSFDVVEILKKQRQRLDDIQINIFAERQELSHIKPFSNIHIQFSLFGNIKEKKAEIAISLAVKKYCSVAASLDPQIKITHAFEINPE